MVVVEREIPPLKAGENSIVHVIDPRRDGRGYMGVRDTGNLDVFWHRWNGSSRVLTHHGGMDGFPDIDIPLRQCRRVITGYIGIEEVIEEDLPEANPPTNLRDFSDLLNVAAESVYIPGSQQVILDIKSQLDRAVREVTIFPGGLRVGGSLNILMELGKKLERSTQPQKQELNSYIQQAVYSNDRFTRFEALLKGSGEALGLLSYIEGVLVGTMQRHNKLEAHRSNLESVAVTWALEVLKQKANLDAVTDTDLVAKKVQEAEDEALSQLITNPFRKKALRIQRFHTVSRKAIELSIWKQDIKEAQRGRYTDRYPLKAS
jgi:hypothetical protein